MADGITNTRACTKCGEPKPLAEFSLCRKVKKDGRRSACRTCINKQTEDDAKAEHLNMVKKYEGDIGWSWVPGFEGLYQASVWGQIRSFYRLKPMILAPRANRDGRLLVHLNKDGESKNYQVHRLVGMAFIPNPEKKSDINHKNGNYQDNRLENLEWATRSENHLHAYANGLKKTVPVIQLSKSGEFIARFKSIEDARRETGVSSDCISVCALGKTKTGGGFKWKKSA